MSQASAAVEYEGEPDIRVVDEYVTPLGGYREPGEPAEDILEYRDTDTNLVKAFKKSERGRSALDRISSHIMSEFKQAWDDSEKWRKCWTDDWKLLMGELPDKDPDFQFCANANIPISLENVSRVATRLVGETFDDFKNVVNFVPLQRGDETAEALTKHSNWQFRVQIPDFKRQMHRACMAFTHIGDWVCHSYYDPERRQNRHEILTPDEFVMPWARQTTMPDLSDLPWYAKVCELQRHQLQARRDSWEDVDWVLQEFSPQHTDEPEQEGAEKVNKLQGQDQPERTKYAPFKVLWWEGWLDLPNQKNQRFVQAHVHMASGRILAMRIHEEPHWQDQQRYDLQMGELTAYQEQAAAYDAQREQALEPLERADQMIDVVTDEGYVSPEVAFGGMDMVDRERAQLEEQLDPLRPQPPTWLQEGQEGPEQPRTAPIYMFTHAVCLEPLVGNRGISYGRIQADLQRAINALLSQYIDAGTFGNMNSFIATPELELKGNLELKPGKINYAKGNGVDDIKKHLMSLTTGNANPQLMEVANLLMENAHKSMQAAEILSGEPGKSGETYKGVAARIEQATKQLSVVGRKQADAVAQIARNNARLNSIFLPDEELVAISDLREGGAPLRITRQMYRENYAVEVTADMRFATNVQKIAEADELMQMVMGMTAPGAPMMGNTRLQYEVISEALRARGRQDLIGLLGPEPPPAMTFGAPMMPPPGMPGAEGGAPPQGGPPQ